MTSQPGGHDPRGAGVDGDEDIIDVVRETVTQLEELTARLNSFLEHTHMEV